MGQKVHVLDLRDGKRADSLNPLDLAVLTGSEPAAVARSLAADLVARTGNERETFWVDWSENLLTAGIAWLLADCEPADRALAHLFDLLCGEDPDYAIAAKLDDKSIRHRAAVAGFRAYLSLPDRETRPSVLGSALMPLRLFDSDLVRGLTGSTTIDLAALVAGEPMTLYIVVPPARLSAFRPLLCSWLGGLMLALTERESLPEHRTLFLCDEIAQLGRLNAFVTAATLMRGYGLQLWSFWQNMGQLSIYGDQARAILDNAGVVQLFGARNRRMAEEFAGMVGGVDADAIMAMGKDEQLLLVEGGRPHVAGRMRYFDDPMFAGLYDATGLRPRNKDSQGHER
jgi:type IV secretion system protein VirD4